MAPINREENVNIKDFNYSDPVNDIDIMLVKSENLSTDPSNPIYEYQKGFLVAPNLIIVPERFGAIENKDGGITPQNVYNQVDNYQYLKTDSEKDQYLKDVTALLKEIALSRRGKIVLNLLTKGTPLPQKHPETNKLSKRSFESLCVVKNKKGESDFKRVNTIIRGPGQNLVEKETICKGLDANNPKADGKNNDGRGYLSRIKFSSIHARAYKIKENYVVTDPKSPLYHELVHCVQNLYGLALHDRYKISPKSHFLFFKTGEEERASEITVFGGPQLHANENIIFEHANLGQIYANMTSYVFNSANNEEKEEVVNSFRNNISLLTNTDTINVEKLTNLEVARKIKDLFLDITETNFSKEVGLPIRKTYSARESVPVLINNFNQDYIPGIGLRTQDINSSIYTRFPKTTRTNANSQVTCRK